MYILYTDHCFVCQSARFYLLLFGTGSKTSSMTGGQLFFRQDQPHIDLFVFFSVFFSCFFLFLAVCVLLWKLKQSHDVRRSRHRRKIEMAHLANRPFASTTLIYDDYYTELPNLYNEFGVSPEANEVHTLPKVSGERNKYQKKVLHITSVGGKYNKLYTSVVSESGSGGLHVDNNQHANSNKNPENSKVGLLALEPLSNNEASVTTILLQMPSGHQGGQGCVFGLLSHTSWQRH